MSSVPSPADPVGGARLTPAALPGSVAAASTEASSIPRATGAKALQHYRDRLRFTDSLAIAGSVLAAVWVRLLVEGQAVMAEPTLQYFGVPVLIALTWMIALTVFRTRDVLLMGAGALEYKRVANATAAAFGILAFVLLLVGADAPRWYFLVALPAGGVSLLLTRWLWRRWLLAQRRRGRYLSRAIVIGSLADVVYVVRQVERNAAAGYEVVGIISDDAPTASLELGARELPVLGGLAEAAPAATSARADAVIVTGDLGDDGDRLRRLGWDLEGTNAELVLSSRLTDVAGPRIHFRPVEGLPLLHVEIPAFDGVRHVAKRGFDILFAGAALLLIAPLVLVIAIAIRLEDGGPVFFRQTRCGRDGRTFDMLKFRSMCIDAEDRLAELQAHNEGAGLLFKLRDDPRVTRIGRLLRAHSLDELPQFWNILIGEMSVVGPRPPLQVEAAAYDGVVSRRLMIKPGLTGLWQISGRSDLDWEESVRLDLYYVENWSMTGDLMIIWRTVRSVVKADGAY
ncbi:sugar transferase [Agromyces sp. NPDC058110]|uniref:sugar transferase n=1 Tax=Agromyces sp. NPDC058110 TaxID=3346345 RepID=UPI0036DCA49C